MLKVEINKWLFQNKSLRILASYFVDRINANLGPYYQSYSLDGEDLIMKTHFNDKSEGFYVDVGANDPFRQSNTAYFYMRGWHGINIDASGEVIKSLNEYRTDDTNVKALIGNSEGKMTLYKFNDSALNTVVKDMAKKYSKIPDYHVVKKETQKVISLKDLLKRYLPESQHIDFLSIDVEGYELEVLKSNDWKIYRPQIIVVELLEIDDIEKIRKTDVYKYLRAKKYRCFAKTTNNLLFRNTLLPK